MLNELVAAGYPVKHDSENMWDDGAAMGRKPAPILTKS
jgi:hypothetical protein